MHSEIMWKIDFNAETSPRDARELQVQHKQNSEWKMVVLWPKFSFKRI